LIGAIASVKAAIFDNDKLTKQFLFNAATSLEKVTDILDTYKPVKAIMCSVVHHDNELADLDKREDQIIADIGWATPAHQSITPIFRLIHLVQTGWHW
jgi:hypothetical protein